MTRKISGNMKKALEILKEFGEVSRSDERLPKYMPPTTFAYQCEKLIKLGVVEKVKQPPVGKWRPRKVYRLKKDG